MTVPAKPDRPGVAQYGQAALPPLRPRRNLREDAASALRAAILSGHYAPGERLVAEQVAAQLGISATPVREALFMVANEGLVRAETAKGFWVAPFRRQDVEDSFKVNAYLGGLLAEAAVGHVTPDLLSNLQNVQFQIESAATAGAPQAAQAVATLNRQFHRAINYSTDSPRLRWFLRAADRFVPTRYYLDIPGWVEASVKEHPPILDALGKGDASLARRLSEQHVAHAGELVVAHLDAMNLWQEGQAGEPGVVEFEAPPEPQGG